MPITGTVTVGAVSVSPSSEGFWASSALPSSGGSVPSCAAEAVIFPKMVCPMIRVLYCQRASPDSSLNGFFSVSFFSSPSSSPPSSSGFSGLSSSGSSGSSSFLSGSCFSSKRITSAKPSSTAFFALIHVSSDMSLLMRFLLSPVFAAYALMMLSLTSFSVAMAFSMSLACPIAIVDGSCTNRSAVGDICTVFPAIAITLAADAAMLAIFTVTLCG